MTYKKSVAKRTADRESRLQRLAMLKRQQLENDEEEFQKSTKKHASSTNNVISTSNSPVKSPQKPSAVFNYSSPSKNQFLPSFNSTQRSFVLARATENNGQQKSPVKSPVKSAQNDHTHSVTTTPELNKTPINSPDKQYLNTTPLQSNTINICSPKPYQKSPGIQGSPIRSPLKSFMCHSPSQASIVSNFTKRVVDFSATAQSSKPLNASDLTSNASNQSPAKSMVVVGETTPVKSLNQFEIKQTFQPQQTKSTSSMQTELSTGKRSVSPVRLFSTVKSSNPIKVISPIKKSGLNTPEKLCVSDKKKLFENAIKEETESAKRVEEQKMFLLSRKFPNSGTEQPNQPSMPKRIKTSIFQFENRNESPRPWTPTARAEFKPEPQLRTHINTEPKILDVEMKHVSKETEDATSSDDEISKFIDQVEMTTVQPANKSIQFENSLHSIPEEDGDLDDQMMDKNVIDLDDDDQQTSLIKSSTKANLYPNLSNLKDENESSDLVNTTPTLVKETSVVKDTLVVKQTPVVQITKSPSKSVSTPTATVKQQQTKSVTPMRTLSQYRREQKQRAVSNSTPSDHQLDLVKKAKEKELERIRLIEYQTDLNCKLKNLKALIENYEKAVEQSSKAITHCLMSSDERGSVRHLEAEKILLLSSHRLDACRRECELTKTKISSTFKAPEIALATGCISIERIQLPLKGDFIIGQSSDQDPLTHHFICLAKCGQTVLATDILDSANSIQHVSIVFERFRNEIQTENEMQFKELDKEFEIQIELYGLALPKEKMHHDKKLNLIKNSMKLTPLSPKLTRSKKAASQLSTYSINQGFTRLGFIKIDLENISNRKYQLDDFINNSPFNGDVEIDLKMKAVCDSSIKLADFLNVQHEGLYWKSRYCVIKEYLLAFWNNKEDYAVKNSPSLGTVDLRNCVNKTVGQAPYSICARNNSFILVTEEEDLDNNQQYKDNKVHKTATIKQHIFAADVKEDFEKWCGHLNKLLPLIRIWEPTAKPPQDLKFLEIEQ